MVLWREPGENGKDKKKYFKEPVKDEVFQLKFSGH